MSLVKDSLDAPVIAASGPFEHGEIIAVPM